MSTADAPVIDIKAAVADLLEGQGADRRIVAIAGCPGSGKSTLADRLCEEINARLPGQCAVLAMDGFHYDDMVLVPRGDRPRKGAPHTFDTGGLRSMLWRLKHEADTTVAVPVFDRSIEIARAGARLIEPSMKLILVEGNYLLLDWPDWQPMAAFFDRTIFLDVPETVLKARLRKRWQGIGLQGAALEAQLEGNDFLNIDIVLRESRPADFRVMNGFDA
ncbi:AAA family ATPase [Tropicimonas sp. IMCC34043]|uniref:AAA family ATPase n=1 Tax=Tropicimonas sp. IMCC34043 TaxID=2248760 RepID=UPI000E26142C|nr:AAA family ATPase [Tropicimonas sp. IMCC34043]